MALDAQNAPVSRSYRMDPARFVELRRRLLTRLVLVGPVIIVFIWFLDGHLSPTRDIFDFIFLPFILAVMGYQSIRRERERWNSLILEFRAGILTRTVTDYPPLEISPNEVTAIAELSHGIGIRTNPRLKALWVNKELLDYDDFRKELRTWAPTAKVVQRTKSVRSLLTSSAPVLGCLAIFGGPLYLMHTPHQELVLPLGLVLTAGMVAMLLYNRRSPNTPISIRYTMWILVLIPLLAMYARLHWN
jgi:hypothetical protein